MVADDTTGASILEVDSYIIALVFLAFLLLFVTYEKVRCVKLVLLCTSCAATCVLLVHAAVPGLET